MTPCVIDTVVLHRANRSVVASGNELPALRRRQALLFEVVHGKRRLLISPRLVEEYSRHLVRPLNDIVRALLEYATAPMPPAGVTMNWKRLTGSERDHALKRCRFPKHDLHLLQTAFGEVSIIFTEEKSLTRAGECIHQKFRVWVSDPTKVS